MAPRLGDKAASWATAATYATFNGGECIGLEYELSPFTRVFQLMLELGGSRITGYFSAPRVQQKVGSITDRDRHCAVLGFNIRSPCLARKQVSICFSHRCVFILAKAVVQIRQSHGTSDSIRGAAHDWGLHLDAVLRWFLFGRLIMSLCKVVCFHLFPSSFPRENCPSIW
jgi:hypothetical protein